MNNKSLSSRKLLTAAVAAALTIPAAYAAEGPTTEVYGRAHVTVDMLDNGDESNTNVSSNSSRIGFRASTEIVPGLKGKVQIEQEIRIDNGPDTPATGGATVNPNNRFASRDTFVGLEGDFGGLRLGYFDTPLKIVRSTTDLFNDQIGDTRNLTRPGGQFDNRFRNSIHYYTPTMGGFRADIDYSTNNDTTANLPKPDPKTTAISAALTYQANGLYAAVAYEKYDANDAEAIRAAASYKFGDATVAGLYQQATVPVTTTTDTDVDTYGLGASYKVSDEVLVKAQYYVLSDDRTDRDASLVAVGLDYILSKPFRLLFAYAMTSNDDNAAYGMSAGGHGDQVATIAGETASGFSAGFRYDF